MNWIALDYPPTANNLFFNVKGRGRARTPKYEAWRTKAAWQIRNEFGSDVISGAYAMYLHAGRPDKRKRDISNLIKPVEDALVLGCAVSDDSNCQSLEAKWLKGVTGVRVLVLPTAEAA